MNRYDLGTCLKQRLYFFLDRFATTYGSTEINQCTSYCIGLFLLHFWEFVIQPNVSMPLYIRYFLADCTVPPHIRNYNSNSNRHSSNSIWPIRYARVYTESGRDNSYPEDWLYLSPLDRCIAPSSLNLFHTVNGKSP